MHSKWGEGELCRGRICENYVVNPPLHTSVINQILFKEDSNTNVPNQETIRQMFLNGYCDCLFKRHSTVIKVYEIEAKKWIWKYCSKIDQDNVAIYELSNKFSLILDEPSNVGFRVN